MMDIRLALAGNPNSGKTTLFNSLTGARQHVGNYPGVTVERKDGVHTLNGYRFAITDLPGTYSLTAYSDEEVVARDFLVDERPELVVNIVDASNLERNLYLTLQFLEMGLPVCIALNMMDVAESRGIRIDTEKLSQRLGVPVTPVIARTGKGKAELMAAAGAMAGKGQGRSPLYISYGEDIDRALPAMTKRIEEKSFMTENYPARWIAIKYMEKDQQILSKGRMADPELSAELERQVQAVADHLKTTLDSDPEAVMADHRYGAIQGLIREGILTREDRENRIYFSDRIDRVVTHRLLGPMIMLVILWGVYQFTFTYSEVPVGWLEGLFAGLADFVDARMADGLLKSLLISGIIGGVGGVLGFVPLILFMFFAIAVLEDTGYLARVAFMLDRVFSFFGLHGSSVMPFIISGGIAGGCAVPGVMAARTLKSPKERLATLLTVPFMNCGAKLPVMALLIGAFFAHHRSQMMLLITLIAWVGALFAAKLLRSTVIRGESSPFVMELPPYRLPTLKGLLIHTWERAWQYIKKAGTVILAISIVLWAMMTFPGLPGEEIERFEEQKAAVMAGSVEDAAAAIGAIEARQAQAALKHSIAGKIGTSLESITRWAGFDWRINIALVGGFAAKEVVVSTLGTAYSMGEIGPEESGSLSETLKAAPGWSPLVAFSLILFTMFYAPCFVTTVCISREAGSWKWGLFAVVFNTTIALLLAIAVFQIGSALGIGIRGNG